MSEERSEMMNWICYLLLCADGSLYCGITNDVQKRLASHNTGGGAKYTRSRRPVHMVYAEACLDKSAALKREAEIKRMSRTQKQVLAGLSSGI